ncbi:MAG: DUF2934 domain-containing protein [Sedimenticolaceae bacterium]
MGRNSEETGRTATKPKVTKKATAKKKTTAQKTSKSAATKDAAAKKTSLTKKAGPEAAGKSAAKKGTRKAAQRILASERHQMIAEAAYLRAEAQGFTSDQHEDWLMAEAEVDARLAKAGRKVVD